MIAIDPTPGDTLNTIPVLLAGAVGYDTVTGKMELVPQTDPDSLKLAPNGDLIFTGNADGAIIDLQRATRRSSRFSQPSIRLC